MESLSSHGFTWTCNLSPPAQACGSCPQQLTTHCRGGTCSASSSRQGQEGVPVPCRASHACAVMAHQRVLIPSLRRQHWHVELLQHAVGTKGSTCGPAAAQGSLQLLQQAVRQGQCLCGSGWVCKCARTTTSHRVEAKQPSPQDVLVVQLPGKGEAQQIRQQVVRAPAKSTNKHTSSMFLTPGCSCSPAPRQS